MLIHKVKLKIGDKRIKIRFAYLPTRIDNNTLIWLEFYYDYQMYAYNIHGSNWISIRRDPFD